MVLNDLFRTGHCVGSIPKDQADALLRLVKQDTFLPDKPGSPDIAEWESDDPSKNLNVPPEYLSFMENLGSSPDLEHFRAHMGDWSRVNVMLQRGRRGDSMGWHHDAYDPMHLICMVYLSDQLWTPEDGGLLQLGEGDIDDMGFITKDVHVHSSVSPNHGTLVWCINTNPRWVHQVTAINTDKPRYTLIGQFGYRENVMRSTVRKRYGEALR
ncbi:2OG-Fe(II) oxygenase [Pseudomonas aeruginosa]|uniref:2OG-Fe(II) oxygenase n=1 Tax=Pseudomonas aeruginosa TaxID=287 RepID=UPI0032B5CD37